MSAPCAFYVKPTNACNVGCSHCYLPEAARADRTLMSMETVEAIGRMGLAMQTAQRAPGSHVIWHGGEPLGVPVEWLEEAGGILDRALPGHTESVQTSLIPYKSSQAGWILGRLGGHVGSSIDFAQRTVKGSVEAYADLWMIKVEQARADGLFVLPGTVPTKSEVDRAEWVVDWFSDRGFPAFNVDRFNAHAGFSPARPTNAEHSRFLDGLLDATISRMEREGRSPRINVTAAALRGVLFDQPGDRWGTTCQHSFVVFEPDGSTNSCPDRGSIDKPFSKAADGWPAFAASPERRKWIQIQEVGHKAPHCSDCPWSSWCRSGCPLTGNGAAWGEDECSGYRRHLDRLRSICQDGRKDVLLAWLAAGDALGAHDGPYAGAALGGEDRT